MGCGFSIWNNFGCKPFWNTSVLRHLEKHRCYSIFNQFHQIPIHEWVNCWHSEGKLAIFRKIRYYKDIILQGTTVHKIPSPSLPSQKRKNCFCRKVRISYSGACYFGCSVVPVHSDLCSFHYLLSVWSGLVFSWIHGNSPGPLCLSISAGQS